MSEKLIEQYVLHIRASDCVQPTNTNTNILIELKGGVPHYGNQDFHVSVASAEIPFTWYNFSSNLTNINMYVDGAPSFVLTAGNYDIYELCDEITNDATFPYDCSYNENTNKITLTNEASDNTQRDLNTTNALSQNLYKALGFDTSADINVAASGSTTGTNCVNLNIVRNLYIVSDALSSSNVLTTRVMNFDSGILAKIPVDVSPGSNLLFNPNEFGAFKTVIAAQSDIQIFDIQIQDQNSNILDLNECNWEMSLMIEVYERDDIQSDTRRSQISPTIQQPSLPPVSQQVSQPVSQSISQPAPQPVSQSQNVQDTGDELDGEIDDLLLRLTTERLTEVL